MTAVANLPSFATINRPAWGNGNQQTLNGSNYRDDGRSSSTSMFAPTPRTKTLSRSSSSSSIASNASTATAIASDASAAATANGGPVGGGSGGANAARSAPSSSAHAPSGPIVRKRPLRYPSTSKPGGEVPSDFLRGTSVGRQQQMSAAQAGGLSALHQLPPFVPGQSAANGVAGGNVNSANGNGILPRSEGGDTAAAAVAAAMQQGQPVLYLLSLNGTFDRKTISVPFFPETLRIGRQTNRSTTPTTINGYFDSKVLSRQHAEIWADAQGKIWIRDIKSSNGTFVNGTRLSAENRESEPHELQTNDRLELGIDIVSEDQKQVVHHKVSAKVEHAGFINPSSNLLEMSFGDLDPSNSSGGLLLGAPLNSLPFRGRPNSAAGAASLVQAGRMAPTSNMAVAQSNGIALQRGPWLTGPSTEAIVKKLNQEMRSAKQQSQDLLRTQEFVKALLSKDDLRADNSSLANNTKAKADTAPADAARPPHMVNGHGGVAFRGDLKTRFSDPPAPPPQQPLPEKPDVSSLKRGVDRPKPGAAMSPVRSDALGQVLQLTEALNTTKREMDAQHARMRELEDRLLQEQEARRLAEELARRLEEAATVTAATAAALGGGGSSGPYRKRPKRAAAAGDSWSSPPEDNDEDEDENETVLLENTIALPPAAVEAKAELSDVVSRTTALAGGSAGTTDAAVKEGPRTEGGEEGTSTPATAATADGALGNAVGQFRARIDTMSVEMEGMKKQLQLFRERAEKAEAERDADRETLAEMVVRIRQRDADIARLAQEAEAAAAAAAEARATAAAAAENSLRARSTSRGRRSRDGVGRKAATSRGPSDGAGARKTAMSAAEAAADEEDKEDEEAGRLGAPSRMNTLTPASVAAQHSASSSSSLVKTPPRDRSSAALQQGIPYASMVGVVLMGMGLMAYLNGWRAQPRLDR